MNETITFFLLVVIIGVPAMFIARSARRLGARAQRDRGLAMWCDLRGWRLAGADDQRVGRWQTAPFTSVERETSELVEGEFRGRAATSLRLETASGPDGPWQTFHVLTAELREPSPVRQLRLDPGTAPGRPHSTGAATAATDGQDHSTAVASAREPADLVERLVRDDVQGMSVRVERGVVVGWLSGVPVLAELDDRLAVLADVAELLEAA